MLAFFLLMIKEKKEKSFLHVTKQLILDYLRGKVRQFQDCLNIAIIFDCTGKLVFI